MSVAGKFMRHLGPAAAATLALLVLAPSCSEQVSVLSSLDSVESRAVEPATSRGASELLSGTLGVVTGTVDAVAGTVDNFLSPQTNGITITVSGLTATVNSTEKLRRIDFYMENGAKYTYDRGAFKYTYRSTNASNIWDVFVETVYGKTLWYRVHQNNVTFLPSGSSVKISSTLAMKKVILYAQDGTETQFSSGSSQGYVKTFSIEGARPLWDVFVETEMGGKWFLDRTPVIRFTSTGSTATVQSTYRLQNVTLYSDAGNKYQFNSTGFVASFTIPDKTAVVEGFAQAEQGSRWLRSPDARIRIAISNKRADVISSREITEVMVLTTQGEKYFFRGGNVLRGVFMVPGPPEIADVYVRTVQGNKWYLDSCPPISIQVAGSTATVAATSTLDRVTLYTASGLMMELRPEAVLSGLFSAPEGDPIVEVCAKAGSGSKWFLDNSRWYQDSAAGTRWYQDCYRAWYQDSDGRWYQDADAT